MSPKELVLVLLVCEIEKVFLKYYLGLDYNDELIISAYNLTLDFARTIKMNLMLLKVGGLLVVLLKIEMVRL